MSITKVSPGSIVTNYTSDFYDSPVPYAYPTTVYSSYGVCYWNYFEGQSNTFQIIYNPGATNGNNWECFAITDGTPSSPLTLAGETSNIEMRAFAVDPGGPDTLGRTVAAKCPSTYAGYPQPYPLGRGSLAILFSTDQSKIKLRMGVPNNRYYTARFYKRDGTLLGTQSVYLTQIDAVTIQEDAFQSSDTDIAGILINTTDPWGIGIVSVEFDVESFCDDAWEPYTVRTYMDSILITDKEELSVALDAVVLSEYDMLLYYVNKDPRNSSKVAKYITDIQDLDVNNWKHIKYIDIIGDYGNNKIKLSWTKTPDYSVWSSYEQKYQTDPSAVQATRWHNLGQARRLAFDIQWIGNSNISHDAIEVYFNIKTE